jgi:hypothetical protein
MTLWALGWKHFFAWIRDLGKKTTQGSTATWTAVKHTGGHLVNHPSNNDCKSCAQMAAQLRKDDEGRYERNGEKPDLELLHEERNNIQHKYANPSSEDAAFHVTNAMKFIRRFTKNELSLDLKDHISSDHLGQLGL